MNLLEQLILIEDKMEEAEMIISKGERLLDELSDEAFQKIKEFIEKPHCGLDVIAISELAKP